MGSMAWGYLSSGEIEKQQKTNQTNNQMKGKFKDFLHSVLGVNPSKAHLICSAGTSGDGGNLFYTAINKKMVDDDDLKEKTVYLGIFQKNDDDKPIYYKAINGVDFKGMCSDLSKNKEEKDGITFSTITNPERYALTIKKEDKESLKNCDWTEVKHES